MKFISTGIKKSIATYVSVIVHVEYRLWVRGYYGLYKLKYKLADFERKGWYYFRQ